MSNTSALAPKPAAKKGVPKPGSPLCAKALYPFYFDFKKSVQAAGVFLQLDGGSMNYMRLLKLLYIADRESINSIVEEPITGDTPFAMERGPILSQLFGYIEGTRPLTRDWQAYFSTDNYQIRSTSDAGRGALSRFHFESITAISKK